MSSQILPLYALHHTVLQTGIYFIDSEYRRYIEMKVANRTVFFF